MQGVAVSLAMVVGICAAAVVINLLARWVVFS
jgi:hypothetical protein